MTKTKPTILVAIPAYNCEKQIGRVVASFKKEILNRIEKVIVIDNISKDGTLESARKAVEKLGSNKIEVWKNKHNYSLGGSHKVAFLQAEKMGADYVAILHGDNQAETKELNKLIDAAIKYPEASAILGSRFIKGSKLIGYSKERIVGNRMINIVYSILAMRPSHDLGSGLNLFKVKDLNNHQYLGFEDSITFNIDLLLYYFRNKMTLHFVPITWKEEDQVSNAKNFAVGKKALIKLIRWRFNKEAFIPIDKNYYKSERIR